jgi:hypothetical protein
MFNKKSLLKYTYKMYMINNKDNKKQRTTNVDIPNEAKYSHISI